MPELRKNVVVASALALVLFLSAACSSGGGSEASAAGAAVTVPANPPRPADCAPAPGADPTTAEGWLGLLAARPHDVALVVDDGRGSVVTHARDAPMPVASAVKVVHVAAYGRAVAEGRLRPDEQVRVGDWENWYLAADGGAHASALDVLGIPRRGLEGAVDPNRTVTLEQIVASMVQVSDNAAADYLRERLGDQALIEAAAAGGWYDVDLPSELGAQLALVRPEDAPPLSSPRVERGPAELALAQRFASDPAFREDSRRRLVALAEDPEAYLLASERWARSTSTGSAAQLAGMWRAVIGGSFGPGADVARAQLEYAGPRPDGQVRGLKGGSFPGVGTMALSVRRPDGSLGVGVLLGRGFPATADPTAVGMAQLRLLAGAVEDLDRRSRVLCLA